MNVRRSEALKKTSRKGRLLRRGETNVSGVNEVNEAGIKPAIQRPPLA